MKILGLIIIAMPFIAMFLWIWKEAGFVVAAKVFGATAFIVGTASLGVYLTQQ